MILLWLYLLCPLIYVLGDFCSSLWIAGYSYVVLASLCPHEAIVLCQSHWNDFCIALVYVTVERIKSLGRV